MSWILVDMLLAAGADVSRKVTPDLVMRVLEMFAC